MHPMISRDYTPNKAQPSVPTGTSAPNNTPKGKEVPFENHLKSVEDRSNTIVEMELDPISSSNIAYNKEYARSMDTNLLTSDISRESSTTSVQSAFMKRGKDSGRRKSTPFESSLSLYSTESTPVRSTVGGGSINNGNGSLLSSPMSPRQYTTHQAQQRTISGSSRSPMTSNRKFIGALTPLVAGSVQSISGSDAKAALASSSEADKKRLVDQFYNSVNESNPVSRASSSSELAQHFKSTSTNLQSPTAEKALKWIENSSSNESDQKPFKIRTTPKIINYTEEKFNSIINNGGFTYTSNSSKLIEDQELTNYLLNIDTILEDPNKENDNNGKSKRHDHHKQNKDLLEPLATIMKSLSLTLVEKSKLNLIDDDDDHIESLAQLNGLSKYLLDLHNSTNELLQRLILNREEIKSNYRSEIKDSLNRLSDLSAELNNLEIKLSVIKNKINDSKTVMSREMADKIELLEYVNDRFKDYSTQKRNMRFKQYNIALAVLVVVVSIYIGYR